jgi:predicted DNA-binding transcriptional regulator AlpA
MAEFSTREAAKKLGLGVSTLSRYISEEKVPAPKSVTSGGATLHLWTEDDIERVRKLLPKIKNGRKTRYQEHGKRKPSSRNPRAKPETGTRRC